MITTSHDRTRRQGFSDLLHYYALVDDGVMLLKNGGYLAAWEFRGPDMASLPASSNWALSSQIASVLRLGPGWTIQTDQMREETHDYMRESPWMPPLSRMIDEERRQQALRSGYAAPHTSRYFLCLAFHPIRSATRRAEDWIFHEEGDAQFHLRHFTSQVADLDAVISRQLGRFPGTFFRRLKSSPGRAGALFDELSGYLRYCITGQSFPFRLPEFPVRLDQYLVQDFTTGDIPKFGDRYLCTVAVDAFPDYTFAGITSGLESLRFPLRYVQQGQIVDGREAARMHAANEHQWKNMQFRNVWSSLLRRGPEPVRKDAYAAKMEADAAEARTEAEHGLEQYLRYAAKIILTDADSERLMRNASDVVDAVKGLSVSTAGGFNCRIETINAVAAWLSSFPGHAQLERRLISVTVSNLVHMMPLSAPWQGDRCNPSQYLPAHTPPVLTASSVGGSPFRVHLHAGASGVGHTLVCGPTGSGKTTYLASIFALWPRLHPQAQIFAFDKDRTLYTLAKAMGGDCYDLSPDTRALRLCPLQELETAADRAHGAHYIEMLCGLNGLNPTAAMRNAIAESIALHAEDHARSITDFQALIAAKSPDVAEALQLYTIGGAGGGAILDGEHDTLSFSNLAVFEIGALYNLDQKITSAVLLYLFRRIERRLDPARPTLLTVDELTASLSQPVAVAALGEFLISARKKNMAVMLCVQELAKIIGSPLAQTINGQCQTRIFLPNAAAATGERPSYREFDATDDDIEIITTAQPCRDYYHVAPGGRRLYSLELGDVALTFLTRSGPADRALADRLIEQNPVRWQADFLRACGVVGWPEYFESMTTDPRKGMAMSYAEA